MYSLWHSPGFPCNYNIGIIINVCLTKQGISSDIIRYRIIFKHIFHDGFKDSSTSDYRNV